MHDGPGVRTTVFLKGCPLHCLWCHNPESRAFGRELWFLRERCTACGTCADACRRGAHVLTAGDGHAVDRSRCTACGQCVQACPSGALEIKGRPLGVDEVIAEIERDRAYYEASGGGMTVSGGEPTAQSAFTLALVAAARRGGIHTCVETCAHSPRERLVELAGHVDLFLIDWKETDPARHRRYTGVDNEAIRQNILALDRGGAEILLRCPIVPSLNDRADHFVGIAALASELRNVRGIEVMPYHPLGASKSRNLGVDYPLEDVGFAQADQVDHWRAQIAARTSVPVR